MMSGALPVSAAPMRFCRALLACAACLATAGCVSASRPSAEGAGLAQYYSALEAGYRSDARFRNEIDPGIPIDPQTLAHNFMLIAFQSETQSRNGGILQAGREIRLSRWEGPIEYSLTGTSQSDEAHLDRLVDRLRVLTRRPISRVGTPDAANVSLFVFNASDRRNLIANTLAGRETSSADFFRAWTQEPNLPCSGGIVSNPEIGIISSAIIFLKSELSGDFRRACLTEEFVQAFGLINDSPEVRPSIFNDDQEFIELTRHDEYLLSILYDPRLRVGMTRREAAPLVEQIARELITGSDRRAKL